MNISQLILDENFVDARSAVIASILEKANLYMDAKKTQLISEVYATNPDWISMINEKIISEGLLDNVTNGVANLKHKQMRSTVLKNGWVPASSLNGMSSPKRNEGYVHPQVPGHNIHINKPAETDEDKHVYWNHQGPHGIVNAGHNHATLKNHLHGFNDFYFNVHKQNSSEPESEEIQEEFVDYLTKYNLNESYRGRKNHPGPGEHGHSSRADIIDKKLPPAPRNFHRTLINHGFSLHHGEDMAPMFENAGMDGGGTRYHYTHPNGNQIKLDITGHDMGVDTDWSHHSPRGDCGNYGPIIKNGFDHKSLDKHLTHMKSKGLLEEGKLLNFPKKKVSTHSVALRKGWIATESDAALTHPGKPNHFLYIKKHEQGDYWNHQTKVDDNKPFPGAHRIVASGKDSDSLHKHLEEFHGTSRNLKESTKASPKSDYCENCGGMFDVNGVEHQDTHNIWSKTPGKSGPFFDKALLCADCVKKLKKKNVKTLTLHCPNCGEDSVCKCPIKKTLKESDEGGLLRYSKYNNPGVVDTYKEANKHYNSRSDWQNLPKFTCKGPYVNGKPLGEEFCGIKSYQEVKGQDVCRDCHSAQGTGFYSKKENLKESTNTHVTTKYHDLAKEFGYKQKGPNQEHVGISEYNFEHPGGAKFTLSLHHDTNIGTFLHSFGAASTQGGAGEVQLRNRLATIHKVDEDPKTLQQKHLSGICEGFPQCDHCEDPEENMGDYLKFINGK